MQQYKTCKVVMLPNSGNAKLGDIFKRISTDILMLDGESIGDLLININPSVTVSNEKFEAQHLYILSDDKIKMGDWVINNFDYDNPVLFIADLDFFNVGIEANKVIASTNSSLGLPMIPEWFIKEYVAKQGKIDEVEVVCYMNYISNELIIIGGEIFIKKPKTTWTKEEVIQLIIKATYDCGELGDYQKVDDWIEQNIK